MQNCEVRPVVHLDGGIELLKLFALLPLHPDEDCLGRIFFREID